MVSTCFNRHFNRHQRDQPIVTYRPTQLLDRAAFLRQWWHPCAETVYEARQKLSRKTSGRGWMGNRGTHQTNRCFGVGIKIIKAIARYYADICHDLGISIIKTQKSRARSLSSSDDDESGEAACEANESAMMAGVKSQRACVFMWRSCGYSGLFVWSVACLFACVCFSVSWCAALMFSGWCWQ